jgi:hypothetical protein
MQWVTIGIAPYSAATVAAVETMHGEAGDDHMNALTPPVEWSGNSADVLRLAQAGMSGLLARGAQSDLAAWNEACRLNPARGAANYLDDSRTQAAFSAIASNFEPAMKNMERLVV